MTQETSATKERKASGLPLWGAVVSGGLGVVILATQLIEATQKFTTVVGGTSPRTMAAIGVALVAAALSLFVATVSGRSRLLRPDSLLLFVDLDKSDNLRGRESDLRELTEICRIKRQTFLYGDSGVGKTALLRAGLWRNLRSSRSLFPIYVNLLADDLDLNGLSPFMARTWDELSDSQRKALNLTKAAAGAEAETVLRKIEDVTGKKPLLIIDQFDDFLSRNSGSLMLNERSWISSDTFVQKSGMWATLRQLIQEGVVHVLAASTSEFAIGFRLITFVPDSETYLLRRVDAGAIRSLLLDLASGENSNAVSHPENGWTQLQDRILKDIAVDGGVLPAQLRIVLASLGSLRALTVDEYVRSGRAEGLESLYVSRYAADCASACKLRKAAVVSTLCALVNSDEMKTYSRTSTDVATAILRRPSMTGSAADQFTAEKVEACLAFLSGRNQLVRAIDSGTGGPPAYSLRHDYLCRGILRLKRDTEQRGELLSELHRQYRERGAGFAAWWRNLMPISMQARMIAGRLKGEFRFDRDRRFALLSLVRTIPIFAAASAYVALADAGVLLPGQTLIQRQLDRRGLSAFRRPRPIKVIKDSASLYRAALMRTLSAFATDGWILASTGRTRGIDPWAHAQGAAASSGVKDCETTPGISGPLILGRLFGADAAASKYGWPDDGIASPAPDHFYLSPPVFWMIAAISTALTRRLASFTEAERHALTSNLAAAMRMRKAYAAAGDRGWTLLVASDPPDASVYATALGAHALMLVRALPDDGQVSKATVDQEVVSSVEWLLSRFEVEGSVVGWRETRGDAISEGLTFQALAVLLRALDAGLAPGPVANLVRKYVPQLLSATCGWEANHADGLSYFYGHSLVPGGPRQEFFRTTSLLWYPWAIECAVAWLGWARKSGEETEFVLRVLSYLVIDLKPNMLRFLNESLSYRVAEALYALRAIEEI